MRASPENDRVGVPGGDAGILIQPPTWADESAIRAICLVTAALQDTAFKGFLGPELDVLSKDDR